MVRFHDCLPVSLRHFAYGSDDTLPPKGGFVYMVTMQFLSFSYLFHGLLVASFLSISIYLVADFLADLKLGEISTFAAFIRDRW